MSYIYIYIYIYDISSLRVNFIEDCFETQLRWAYNYGNRCSPHSLVLQIWSEDAEKKKYDSVLRFAVNEYEHIKANDNGAACSLHRKDKERIQNFSTKIWREEKNLETQT